MSLKSLYKCVIEKKYITSGEVVKPPPDLLLGLLAEVLKRLVNFGLYALPKMLVNSLAVFLAEPLKHLLVRV